jgi:sigma-B regulation protein RsbU (phosphoserine phosphatase)
MLPNGRSVVRCIPARTVGGDFYGTIPYPTRGLVASIMADVSGKGAAAAVYAALANGFLHSCAAEELDPQEMLKRLNQHLIQLTNLDHFVAMMYSTWDERERVAEICNGGLPAPLLCRRGEVQPLPVYGMPLGLLPDCEYEQVRVEYLPGDTVLFCTDGVIEAFNPEGEEFGFERLSRVLCENSDASPDAIVDSVVAAVRQHCRGEPFMDDLTVGVLEVA